MQNPSNTFVIAMLIALFISLDWLAIFTCRAMARHHRLKHYFKHRRVNWVLWVNVSLPCTAFGFRYRRTENSVIFTIGFIKIAMGMPWTDKAVEQMKQSEIDHANAFNHSRYTILMPRKDYFYGKLF